MQAYIPEICGMEGRKSKAGKDGLLGVEGMNAEVLLETLRRCGATFEGEASAVPAAAITKVDMMEKGLVGPNSAKKRQELLKKLQLPSHMTANALMDALNLLLTREEFDAL